MLACPTILSLSAKGYCGESSVAGRFLLVETCQVSCWAGGCSSGAFGASDSVLRDLCLLRNSSMSVAINLAGINLLTALRSVLLTARVYAYGFFLSAAEAPRTSTL